jgi:acetolactate synthase-1/2/3 large subunit
MTGGQAVVSSLELHGVATVFGISGVHTLPIYDALVDSKQIIHYTSRHEQAAGFEALGYALATGKIGVCTLISGPGFTNAATPLAQAYSDSVPMLVITSNTDSRKMGRWRGQLHELKDQTGVGNGLCEYSRLVTRVEDIPRAIAAAFHHMRAHRPRPVHIDIPTNILFAAGDTELVGPYPVQVATPPAAPVGQAADMIRRAQRPLIIAGGGCIGSADRVRDLMERIDCPVIVTCNGKGVVPARHPLALPARFEVSPALFDLVREADLLLLLGTKVTNLDTGFRDLTVTGSVIQVDIDPSRIGANVKVDLPIVADVGVTVEALLDALGGYQVPADWVGSVRAIREQLDAEEAGLNDVYHAIMRTVRRSLAPDGVLVNDMTQASYRGVLYYPTDAPRLFLFPRTLGSLGFGLPAAVGAKIGLPHRQVVALCGDGGFQFTMGELGTAVQYRLSIPIIVCNNNSYWTVREAHKRMFNGRSIACDLVNPDFVALAEAYRIPSARVTDVTGDLPGVLAKAFDAAGPTMIEIPVSENT